MTLFQSLFFNCGMLWILCVMNPFRALRPLALACGLACVDSFATLQASDGVQGTALVRHAPDLNGTVEGSVHQMMGEGVTLNGGAVVSGNLLVPGTPRVRLNGKPAFDAILEGTGLPSPTSYEVILNGGATLGNLVRRTDPVGLEPVDPAVRPSGSRDVVVQAPGQPVGAWSTVKNLTLNGNAGTCAVPP